MRNILAAVLSAATFLTGCSVVTQEEPVLRGFDSARAVRADEVLEYVALNGKTVQGYVVYPRKGNESVS